MRAKNQTLVFVILSIILFSQFSLALTASIGNSRMILRTAPGEDIERSILVKNVNDVPVNVTFTVSGDLADTLELRDQVIYLQPGDEDKAFFTVSSESEGSYETKINVLFTPEEGNAVGLTSTVVLVAGSGEAPTNIDSEKDNSETDSAEDSEGFSLSFGGDTPSPESASGSVSFSPIIYLSISTIVLALALVGLLFYASKKTKPKKRVKGANA